MRQCRRPFLYLVSGKGSCSTRWTFHCFKELEKSLNKTPMWSTDCGGTSGAPCWNGGKRSKGHPHSMDGVEGSQTYHYMHGIDRGRGMQTKVSLGQTSGERVCVLRWMDLTTWNVSTSPEAFICQIHARKIKGFVDDGLDIRIRCVGKDNYKYKNKSKITFLNERWPKTHMSSDHEVWYKYRSIDTCIVTSWLVNRGDWWEMVSKLSC